MDANLLSWYTNYFTRFGGETEMWIAARRLMKATTRMLGGYRKAPLQGLKPFSSSDLTAGLKPRPSVWIICCSDSEISSARSTGWVAWCHGGEFAIAQVIVDAPPANGVAGEAG